MDKKGKDFFLTILVMFFICFFIKGVEFLFIKTDTTFIGENIICKIACIIATLLVTYRLSYNLSDIGFKQKNVVKYAFYGFILGIITFSASFGIEMLILNVLDKSPRFSIYITNFGLSGATNEISFSFIAFIICVLGNIINVLAEEGMFRGLMLKAFGDIYGFKVGNFIQAFLFGFWHVISCVQGVLDGSMTVLIAFLFSIGYIILAGILAFEWGLCFKMTGVLWVGIFEHFFNNFVSNVVHVLSISNDGLIVADNLQIIRIVLSNIFSLSIVLIIYFYKKNKLTNKDI